MGKRKAKKDPYKKMAADIVASFDTTEFVDSVSGDAMLARLVELMDGDANDRLLQALKEIDAERNPHLYVLAEPLTKKEKK